MMQRFFYTSKLAEKDWKTIRTQLVQEDHVEKAKLYLEKIPSHIRIFITDGQGFGDQMFVVNIIEQLHQLGYKGPIEIVGHLKEISDWLNTPFKSALRNILKLYDAEHLFNPENSHLSFKLMTGNLIHFYDYAYFEKNKEQFPEVGIALFPGLIGRFYNNYYNASLISFYLTSSYFDALDQMSSIAKSKKSIFLSFYTALFFGSDASLGLAIQTKGKNAKIDFHSQTLGYPVVAKPFSMVEHHLLKLKEKKAVLGNNVEQLVMLQKHHQIDTFSIYAIHHLPSPKDTIMNLLLGSQLAHAGREKPLLVYIMSPISDASWNNLQKNCKIEKTLRNHTLFYELESKAVPKDFDPKMVYVLRFVSVPWPLFNYLFNSTYPPVYEGINSAMELQRHPGQARFGLPCPKLKGGRRFPVADQAELPDELSLAGPYLICPLSLSPDREPVVRTKIVRNAVVETVRYPAHYYLAFLMAKYAGRPLPLGFPSALPHPFKKDAPVWEFNHSRPLQLSFKEGDDRLSYALALASREEEEESYSEADDHQGPATFYDWRLAAQTGTKGFFYGFLEHSAMRSGQILCQLPEDKAHRFGKSCSFMLKGLLDNQTSSAFFLLAMDTILDLTTDSFESKKNVHMALTTLLFMSEWLPQFFELDWQQQFFISSIMMLTLFAHTLGQRASHLIWREMTNYRFFSHSRPLLQESPSASPISGECSNDKKLSNIKTIKAP